MFPQPRPQGQSGLTGWLSISPWAISELYHFLHWTLEGRRERAGLGLPGAWRRSGPAHQACSGVPALRRCAYAHAGAGHDARASAPFSRPSDDTLRFAGPPGVHVCAAFRLTVAGVGPRLLRRRPPLLGSGLAGGGLWLVGGRGLRLPAAHRGLGRLPSGLQSPVLVH